MRPPSRGFTLIELVMVMVLLGVMATFTSQFVSIGTEIYSDASQREQLMSDARYALERLNRELRDAVPGSVRVEDLGGNLVEQGVCLRFWPIATASRYLSLNPGNELSIVTPSLPPEVGELAIIYPLASPDHTLDQGCLHGNCVARVLSVGTPVSGAQSLRVDNTFAKDSPGQRIYFADRQVRYCVTGSVLTRASAAIGTEMDAKSAVLMAEHIRPAPYYFYRDPAAFSQSEVGLRLVFEQNDESVTFNHKLELLNVP